MRASSHIPLTMATGAVMAVKMKAKTVPVLMAASCTRFKLPGPAVVKHRRSAVAARQAVAPSRGHHSERAATICKGCLTSSTSKATLTLCGTGSGSSGHSADCPRLT